MSGGHVIAIVGVESTGKSTLAVELAARIADSTGLACTAIGEHLREDDPSLIGRHAAAMHGARSMGYLYQLLAMTGWTSLPWLWSLPQPTLILMGRDDPLVPPVNGQIMASLIPNAELHLLDDGHLFMVTRPTETAGLIEAFLADESRQAVSSALLSRTTSYFRDLVPTSGGGRQKPETQQPGRIS